MTHADLDGPGWKGLSLRVYQGFHGSNQGTSHIIPSPPVDYNICGMSNIRRGGGVLIFRGGD